MMSKIKVYIGIAAAAVIAFLGVWVKLLQTKASDLESDLGRAEDDIRKVTEINANNEKVREVEDGIKKAVEDSRADSIDDVRERLLRDARDRDSNGD